MYPIISVPEEAAFLTEQLGTKQKFWFRNDGVDFLFKEPRPNTGEDWAEKIASELCELLNLPHARYDLAVWKGRRGVISPNFAPSPCRLVHGNELLSSIDKSYPRKRFFHVQEHILRKVLAIIKRVKPKSPVGWDSDFYSMSAEEIFVGYLMFDAWIANQDRHHENWSILVVPPKEKAGSYSFHLAPSYDHASSLGRNESDPIRIERLNTKDMGRHISSYVKKANSAFYTSSPNQVKLLSTIDAFIEVGMLYHKAATTWLEQLNKVTAHLVRDIVDQIPKELITEPAIEFACAMLDINRKRLLSLKDKFS